MDDLPLSPEDMAEHTTNAIKGEVAGFVAMARAIAERDAGISPFAPASPKARRHLRLVKKDGD